MRKKVELEKRVSLSFPLLPSLPSLSSFLPNSPYLAGIKQRGSSSRVHQIHRGPAGKQPGGNVVVAHDALEGGREKGREEGVL